MARLIGSLISFCLFLGVTDALVNMTMKMAGMAVHAHQHDQLSYAKFTREMTSAHPRSRPQPEPTPVDRNH